MSVPPDLQSDDVSASSGDATQPDDRTLRWAKGGALVGLVLLVLVSVIPPLFAINTNARFPSPDGLPVVPFLRAYLRFDLFGPGTIAAVLLGLLGFVYLPRLAERMSWRWLLVLTWVVGIAWLLALAFVDGAEGVSRSQSFPDEYLTTARGIDDIGAMLQGFVARIPEHAPNSWATHVSGHPPGALLFFVVLVRLGVTSAFSAGLAIVVVASTAVPAVLITVRALGAESAARRAAPFLVLTPAAIFMATSADAVFATVAAWGLACLALAATAATTRRWVAWSLAAGLLLGYLVMMSYGLVLMAIPALAVLAVGRSWRPLPIVAVVASGVVATFGVLGFWWWDGYAPLHDRYWAGIAYFRPQSYWFFGDLAALLVCAGPVLAVSLAISLGRLREILTARRPVALLLGLAAALSVLLADLSRMSKAEVERIWLPFVPLLLLTTAALPARWRRPALAVQIVAAVVCQHLLLTEW